MARPPSENPESVRGKRLVFYVDNHTFKRVQDELTAHRKSRPSISLSDMLFEWVKAKLEGAETSTKDHKFVPFHDKEHKYKGRRICRLQTDVPADVLQHVMSYGDLLGIPEDELVVRIFDEWTDSAKKRIAEHIEAHKKK